MRYIKKHLNIKRRSLVEFVTNLLGSILVRKFLSNKVKIRNEGAIPEL